ncbi:hypothetical protein [Salipaludibacillus aurantiacus]|uniref:Uncharacterized protein n=1 Tax=Salipaludibacillus aurantiacus TaxID=1601833 RepID=A0A1H9UTT6_9BACI|nr:hypothetical protein [Salipaludibacillus aurantiacus]SES12739.1 hypothetical protein SAMN05518684_108166 [Salipaludibacillus aurantiacus]
MSIRETIDVDYEWKGTTNTSLHVLYQDDVCLCYNDSNERISTCNREELLTFIKDLKEGQYAR